jgi:hypothetical protein
VFALDERGAPARSGQRGRKWTAGLAGPDDDGIVLLR